MFRQKKNKRFTYSSQFLGNQKLEEEQSIKSKITSDWQSSRRKEVASKKITSSLVVLVLLLAVIITVMYYLDAKLR